MTPTNPSCRRCGTPLTESNWSPSYRAKRNKVCRECNSRAARRLRERNGSKYRAASRARFLADPRLLLFNGAKRRAKVGGLPFNLALDDIVVPQVCPVLGIRLVRGRGRIGPRSPTLDRIVPELGYTKGNVAVISHRANLVKSNSTPADLMAVAKWVFASVKPRH